MNYAGLNDHKSPTGERELTSILLLYINLNLTRFLAASKSLLMLDASFFCLMIFFPEPNNEKQGNFYPVF